MKPQMRTDKLIKLFIDSRGIRNKSTLCQLNRIGKEFQYLGELTYVNVITRINALRATHKGSSINRELTLIKQFCAWLVDQNFIKFDPVHKIRFEKLPPSRIRWLKQDEQDAILSRCPNWLANIVVFALETGMRRGEILGLKWDAVDMDLMTVTIFQSKNNESRIIPLTSAALNVLTKIKTWPTGEYVFCIDGTPVTDVKLENVFRYIIKKSGVKDVHFHDLRHTFATRLVQNGADIYAVQRLLGHKSAEMTHRYSHHSIESLRKALEVVKC